MPTAREREVRQLLLDFLLDDDAEDSEDARTGLATLPEREAGALRAKKEASVEGSTGRDSTGSRGA